MYARVKWLDVNGKKNKNFGTPWFFSFSLSKKIFLTPFFAVETWKEKMPASRQKKIRFFSLCSCCRNINQGQNSLFNINVHKLHHAAQYRTSACDAICTLTFASLTPGYVYGVTFHIWYIGKLKFSLLKQSSTLNSLRLTARTLCFPLLSPPPGLRNFPPVKAKKECFQQSFRLNESKQQGQEAKYRFCQSPTACLRRS